MIESTAAAAASTTVMQLLIDRVGQALGPARRAAPVDLDDALSHFELPGKLQERLTPPFDELGFSLGAATLQDVGLRVPPSYTVATRRDLELAFINLPAVLLGARDATVWIANGLGYAFAGGSPLHLFAEGRDALPEFMDTATKSWTRAGVTARFHPWLRVTELEMTEDPASFVMRVFEITEAPSNGDAAPAAAGGQNASELSLEQWQLLHQGLKEAFPSYNALKLMLRGKLGRNLPDIASEAKLDYVVLDLMEVAIAGGWLRDLVTGARRANEGNPTLHNAVRRLPPGLGGESS